VVKSTIEAFFKNTFQMPVFESFRFLPGYRNTPAAKDDKSSLKERVPLVMDAYNNWIGEHFTKE
jgi:hypothetical protein